jgi:RNA polymerase sigma factor (sigma-70 family)
MSFNKGYEFKQFEMQWEKERRTMLMAGMKEGDIKEIYDFDRLYFNSRRRYEEHKINGISLQHVGTEIDFEQHWHFMNLITDEKLYMILKELKASELELLELFAIKGFKITEIAQLEGKSKSTISEKLNRIINKIKKKYINPNNK